MPPDKYFYKYDDYGNHIETIYPNENEETIHTIRTFIRDNKGTIVESKTNSYFINTRTIYKYDDKGNKLQEEDYNQGDTIPSVTFYKYNDKNDITEQSFFDNKTNTKYIVYKIKYKYDSKGNWIKKTKYNEDGSVDYIIKRKIEYYDE